MTDTKHLWEVEHDYYGASQCYYANFHQQAEWNREYTSWSEFSEDGDSLFSIGDKDAEHMRAMNFLYRWDWQRPDPEDLDEDEYAGDTLELFWIFPRKGMISKVSVQVTEEDEPAVREWLQLFANYMRDMWAPFDLSPEVR